MVDPFPIEGNGTQNKNVNGKGSNLQPSDVKASTVKTPTRSSIWPLRRHDTVHRRSSSWSIANGTDGSVEKGAASQKAYLPQGRHYSGEKARRQTIRQGFRSNSVSHSNSQDLNDLDGKISVERDSLHRTLIGSGSWRVADSEFDFSVMDLSEPAVPQTPTLLISPYRVSQSASVTSSEYSQ